MRSGASSTSGCCHRATSGSRAWRGCWRARRRAGRPALSRRRPRPSPLARSGRRPRARPARRQGKMRQRGRCRLAPSWLRQRHRLKEGALLAQDESPLLSEAEVCRPVRGGLEARAIGLVGSQAVEGNEPKGHIVGALVRQEVADELAAALGNDRSPIARVLGESFALKGIDGVADDDGDGHGWLLSGSHYARCFRRIASIRPEIWDPVDWGMIGPQLRAYWAKASR